MIFEIISKYFFIFPYKQQRKNDNFCDFSIVCFHLDNTPLQYTAIFDEKL